MRSCEALASVPIYKFIEMTGRCPDEISKSAEAIAKLSAEQYRVTQENGTERLGTGEYLYNKEPGIYVDTCLWRTAFRFVGQI